jgi:hypothetical protein
MDSQDGPDGADRQRLVRLALADWSEAAEAHVDSVLVSKSRAAVNLLVNGDYEYCIYLLPGGHGQWEEAWSSSGHADRAYMDAQDEEA